MRRVRKVKVDKRGKISLDWEVQVGHSDNFDEYHMLCSDKARPEFYKAMEALSRDVLTLLEYPDTWLNDITVKGVSFSYSQNGVKGAVITAQRTLQHSTAPENCNTPHKPYEMYADEADDPDGTMTLPEDTQDRLDALDEEAQRYIDGDRSQMSLDFEEKKEEGEA